MLTHHPRPSLVMHGSTTSHFLDASPAEAPAAVRQAAGDLDVGIIGCPATVPESLVADLVDHLLVVLDPLILGRGAAL